MLGGDADRPVVGAGRRLRRIEERQPVEDAVADGERARGRIDQRAPTSVRPTAAAALATGRQVGHVEEALLPERLARPWSRRIESPTPRHAHVRDRPGQLLARCEWLARTGSDRGRSPSRSRSQAAEVTDDRALRASGAVVTAVFDSAAAAGLRSATRRAASTCASGRSPAGSRTLPGRRPRRRQEVLRRDRRAARFLASSSRRRRDRRVGGRRGLVVAPSNAGLTARSAASVIWLVGMLMIGSFAGDVVIAAGAFLAAVSLGCYLPGGLHVHRRELSHSDPGHGIRPVRRNWARRRCNWRARATARRRLLLVLRRIRGHRRHGALAYVSRSANTPRRVPRHRRRAAAGRRSLGRPTAGEPRLDTMTTLRVGVAYPDPPFNSMGPDRGGLDIDLITAIGATLGLSVTARRLPGRRLQRHLRRTEHRLLRLRDRGNHGDPRTRTKGRVRAAVSGVGTVAGRRHRPVASSRSVDELVGLTIGVQRGNTSQPIAERLVVRGQGQAPSAYTTTAASRRRSPT